MTTDIEETLRRLFEKCIAMAIEDVQKQVAGPLPTQLALGLESFGQRGKVLTWDEVMLFLYQDGTFPRIVDVAVRGIKDERTLMWIRPSDHPYVNDFSQTWNTPKGMGPFKSVGLIAPYQIWHRPRPLSIEDLKESGEMWAPRPRPRPNPYLKQ